MTVKIVEKPSNNKSKSAEVPVSSDVEIEEALQGLFLKAEDIDLKSITSSAEDEFAELYIEGNVIEPQYDKKAMRELVDNNNTLKQAIAAYVVNIEETGSAVVPVDGEEVIIKDVPEDLQRIRDLFEEPWPLTTFLEVRKALREDIESVGEGYLEIIRSSTGELQGFKHVDSTTMRIVKLHPRRLVARKVKRNGKVTTVTVYDRPRTYVQVVNNEKNYFVEYGAGVDVNRRTGEVVPPGELSEDERGGEVLRFYTSKDINNPYGVPRWINQIPSVVGSRKAEELNLEYFNSGGVPPLLIFLVGGLISKEQESKLNSLLNKQAKHKLKAAVVNVNSAAGSVDESTKNVGIKVERFGSETQNDSLFEKYIEKCSTRTRSSLRIPPLFFGLAEDYSFASVFASYVVAEAQVFAPERKELDDKLTLTIIRELDPDCKYRLKSNPLSVSDATLQLSAIMGLDRGVSTKETIRLINEITGLNIQYSEEHDLEPGESGGSKDYRDIPIPNNLDNLDVDDPKDTPSLAPAPSRRTKQENFTLSRELLSKAINNLVNQGKSNG